MTKKVIFETLSGELEVSLNNGRYLMDFPRRDPISATLPNEIKNALNIQPVKVLKARDYLLERALRISIYIINTYGASKIRTLIQMFNINDMNTLTFEFVN